MSGLGLKGVTIYFFFLIRLGMWGSVGGEVQGPEQDRGGAFLRRL